MTASQLRQTQSRKSRLQEHLQDVLDDSLKYGSLGCVLGLDIPKQPRIVLTAGHTGMDTDEPVTRQNLFQIGSVTKMLTSATVLKLVKQGHLSLEDDIREFVPGVPGTGKIPLFSLLNHSSGLGNASAVLDPVRRLVNYPLDFKKRMFLSAMRGQNGQPGEKYEYNNVGYWIVGELVKTITGQPFEQYLQNAVLNPLNLTHTYVGTSENLSALPLGQMARGYHLDENSTKPVETTTAYSLSEADAAGNLVSSVDDLLDWLHAVAGADKSLGLSLADFQQHLIDCDDDYSVASDRYGMGMIRFKFGGLECWGHGGAMCGYMCLAMMNNHSGIRLSMLSNKITKFGPGWLDQQKFGFFHGMLALRMAIEAFDSL